MVYASTSSAAGALAVLLSVVLQTHVAADCSSFGKTECVLLVPYYSEYQWATCVSKSYIEQLSAAKGKNFTCSDRNASTQCYFQCMLEIHDIDRGPVYDDCSCLASPSAPSQTSAPSTPLPSYCFSPSGNTCFWYKGCLDKRYSCLESPYEYAISYGTKFCKLFEAKYSDFEPITRVWVDATRKCLQVRLVKFIRPWVTATCKDIYTEAFRTHPDCYTAPDTSGTSICSLPCLQLWKIFWIVKGSLISPPIETARQMFQVIQTCLKNRLDSVTCLPRAAQTLVYISVNIARTQELILDLAGRLVDVIEKKLDWKQKGIGVLPFTNDARNSRRKKRSVTNDETQSSNVNIQLLLADLSYLGVLNRTVGTVAPSLSPNGKTLENAVEGLVDIVKRGDLSNIQVTVNDTVLTTGVSSVGQCYNVECNATMSNVLGVAPTSAAIAQSRNATMSTSSSVLGVASNSTVVTPSRSATMSTVLGVAPTSAAVAQSRLVTWLSMVPLLVCLKLGFLLK